MTGKQAQTPRTWVGYRSSRCSADASGVCLPTLRGARLADYRISCAAMHVHLRIACCTSRSARCSAAYAMHLMVHVSPPWFSRHSSPFSWATGCCCGTSSPVIFPCTVSVKSSKCALAEGNAAQIQHRGHFAPYCRAYSATDVVCLTLIQSSQSPMSRAWP